MLVSMVILLSGCNNHKYDTWTTVTMENCGTIKFPGEWEIKEKDGFYIVSEKESDKVKFIGCERYNYDETDTFNFSVGDYSISVKPCVPETSTSEVFSNSAIWGEQPITCNGEEIEKTYYILLSDGESERIIEYICVDKTDIDDELVADIAKSYEMETHE